jgi:5-methyltetrahydrofolate--homocysteine methyltransferase
MNWNIEKHQPRWNEVRERFEAWWKRSSCGRPLMRVIAKRDKPSDPIADLPEPTSNEQNFLDPDYNVARYRNFLHTHEFMAESFPNTNVNIGPGSLAVYLGAEPYFAPDTVWYKHCIEDWNSWEFKYDPENPWLKRHLAAIKRQTELASGEFLVGIPDLLEGVDILSAMRDPMQFCYDLIDQPEQIRKHLAVINELYHKYFDSFHQISKDEEGNCFTCFEVWGKGKTVKLQCDFAALMNPEQFKEFVVPYLTDQARHYDRRLYHFDGADALPHLDALLGIEEIDALQWTPGAGKAPMGDEKWFPIYDRARDYDKALWFNMYGYDNYNELIAVSDRLVKRYGDKGVYLMFPTMSKPEAESLIRYAEKNWHS